MQNLLFKFLNYQQNKILKKRLAWSIKELDSMKYDRDLIKKSQDINNENKTILENNLNLKQTISDLDLYSLKLKKLYEGDYQ